MTQARSPAEIARQGLQLNDGFPALGLGARSLALAMKAFSETYRAVKYVLPRLFHDDYSSLLGDDKESARLGNAFSYHGLCFQTIAFLQHFVELELKSILRADHPLLAVEAKDRHVVLHKLLKGESLQEEEWTDLNSIEFTATLNRLVSLVRSGRLGQGLEFVLAYEDALRVLNSLRNRMWHRGTYILEYKALDQLLLFWIFPFIEQLLSHRGPGQVWGIRELACGVDPVAVMLDDGKAQKYLPRKLALLKEMCRASFNIPFSRLGTPMADMGNPLAMMARRGDTMFNWPTKSCLVCGGKSLVLFRDEAYSTDDGSPCQIVVAAVCFACGFEINMDHGNPSEYGLDVEDILW